MEPNVTLEGPRGVRPQELPNLIALTDSVFRADAHTSMGDDFPLLFHRDNLDDLRVFVDDGVPVSHVGMFRRDIVLAGTRHRSCSIGAVCTHPDYRGRGLASRLVEEVRGICREAGVDIFLISGGRGLYTRLGFVNVGGYRFYSVEKEAAPEDRSFRMRPWEPSDVAAFVRMHSAERTRFVREPSDFRTLLEAGRIHDGRADTRAVCQPGSDEPVAYVTYKLPGAKRVADDALEIDEMAGSRAAVVGAMHALFEEYGVARVIIDCLDSDGEMRAFAQSYGWSARPHGFMGTVGIVDPDRFWRSCEDLFRERLGGELLDRLSVSFGEQIAFELDGERLEIGGMKELTQLVFLPRERRSEMEVRPTGRIAKVLDELFPLPLVSYGLNFI